MVVLKALSWDSRHFGLPICRVELERGGTAEALVSSLTRSRFKFASARTRTGDTRSSTLLENAGFRIADVRLYLDLMLDRFKAPQMVSGLSMMNYRKEHKDSLKEIARTSFWSDHFHADPRFDRKKVDDMYALWVEKCVRENYSIAVACQNELVAGFLAGKQVDKAYHIELVAVRKHLQGRNVGHDLVVYALAKSRKMFKHASIAVQLSNVAALRLYEKIGFRIARSEFTFHWWRN